MSVTTTKRLSDIRQRMSDTKTDLLALAPGAHMDWLLGFHPHPDERPCLLLISNKKEAFLMPALNAKETRKHTEITFFEWTDDNRPNKALREAIVSIGADNAKEVALDETMRADFALLLLDCLDNAKYQFSADTVGALRMRKNQDEYQLLKENALINDHAMQACFANLKLGMNEREVADVIHAHHQSEGAKTVFSIVGSAENGAFPHHATSDRKLQISDAVLIDIGARYKGFPSDMTRMAVMGHAPEGYQTVHDIVNDAVEAALATAKPGVTANKVDAAARDVIRAAGYGQYFIHRTGHGLGIEVHEPPYITESSTTILDEGMVFSIEPGIYLTERFGVRLEEIVILRTDGPEILSELSRDVFVVEC